MNAIFSVLPMILASASPLSATKPVDPSERPEIRNVRVYKYPGVCSKKCWKFVRPEWKLECNPVYTDGIPTYVWSGDGFDFGTKTYTIMVAFDCVRINRKYYLHVNWKAPSPDGDSRLNMSVPPRTDDPYTGEIMTSFEHHACRTVDQSCRGLAWRVSIIDETGTQWCGSIEAR